jgi:RHS repeat-associated protein
VRTTTPPLSVGPVTGTTDYEFEVASDNRFTNDVHNSGWLPSTPTYPVPAAWKLHDGATYYWHARIRTSTGAVSPWVGPRSFDVQLKMLGLDGGWPLWSNGALAVNEINGNLVYTAPTPSYPTAAASMGLSIDYNSLGTDNQGLGTGWTFTAGQGAMPGALTELTATSGLDGAEVAQRDGGTSTFSHIGGSNVFTPGAFPKTRLSKNDDGSYTLTTPDGSVYSYSAPDANGVSTLVSSEVVVTSAGADKLTYSFSGETLTRITDVDGRQLTITWHSVSASGCPDAILCVTGPDNVRWKYVGDAGSGTSGRVVRINDGVRDIDAFTYDTGGRMATIKNANDLNPGAASPGYNASHSLQIAYDASHRVASISDGPIGGQSPSTSTWSFGYHPGTIQTAATRSDHPATPAGTTRQADGYTTTESPGQQGQPNPKLGTIYYDEFNHTIEQDDPVGAVALTGWTVKGQVAWTEDAAGKPTDFTYDSVTGDLLTTTGPDPDGAGALGRPVTVKRYDEQAIGTAGAAGPPTQGLDGSYFSNPSIAGRPAGRRTDGKIDFTWGSGGPSPLGGQADHFSARWTGRLVVPQTGDYVFSTYADGGTNLVVDNFNAIADLRATTAHWKASQSLHLKAGSHTITAEFAELTGSAQVHLYWQCLRCASPIARTIVPVSALRPAWANQTTTVSPSGHLAFSHFAKPWTAKPDYVLEVLGSTSVITSYSYDAYGRTTRKVQPKGNTGRSVGSDGGLTGSPNLVYSTAFAYYGVTDTAAPPAACGGGSAVSQAGQLKTRTPHGITATTYTYDSASRVIAIADGRGTICTTFDQEGRMTQKIKSGDAQPTTYSYDPGGNERTASNASGTITFVYNESNQVLDTVDSHGAETAFSYDADGNPVLERASTHDLVTGPVYTTSYAYDAVGELTSLTDPASKTFQFTHDPRGLPTTTQYPNGTFSWRSYDDAGRLVGLYNRHGTLPSQLPAQVPADSQASPIADYTYAYNAEGQVRSETRTGGGLSSETMTYGYDDLNRVSSVVLPDGTQRTYAYDLDSNRTSIVETPPGGSATTKASYTYDPTQTAGLDELTQVTASATTTQYSYDSAGGVKARGNDTFQNDAAGRLTTATVAGATVSYAYDALDRRRSRTAGGSTVDYLYALASGAPTFEINGSGLITRYATESTNAVLAEYAAAPTSSAAVRFVYSNGHGDTAALADSAGNRTSAYTYDPFGARRSGGTAETSRLWLGQAEKVSDPTSALITLGSREYDPALGRFLSRDVYEDRVANSYAYGDCDPVNNQDLSGNKASPIRGEGTCGTVYLKWEVSERTFYWDFYLTAAPGVAFVGPFDLQFFFVEGVTADDRRHGEGIASHGPYDQPGLVFGEGGGPFFGHPLRLRHPHGSLTVTLTGTAAAIDLKEGGEEFTCSAEGVLTINLAKGHN